MEDHAAKCYSFMVESQSEGPKKERLQEKFEKLVKRVRERHDKMVEKGCTFEKINQSAGARELFVNHGKMCESRGAYLKGKR